MVTASMDQALPEREGRGKKHRSIVGRKKQSKEGGKKRKECDEERDPGGG